MKTTAVDSAAKAFDAIKEIEPDILISDVGLPGEDGYELIRKIRRLWRPNKADKYPPSL